MIYGGELVCLMQNKVNSIPTGHKAILFRSSLADIEEREVLDKMPGVLTSRVQVTSNHCIIVGRYSVLPHYREVARDISIASGGKASLINSPEQHEFLADLTQWYPLLKDLTPESYDSWGGLPEGAYIVKGKTNSRKFNWDTHMFAPTAADVPRIACTLMDDSFIGDQGIVCRKYYPLVKLAEGLNGLPISLEYRVFVMGGSVLAIGEYWPGYETEYKDTTTDLGDIMPSRNKLIENVISRVDVPFYVVDVGMTVTGKWIVIELNDGQMSGLGGIDPTTFYEKMTQVNTLPGIGDIVWP